MLQKQKKLLLADREMNFVSINGYFHIVLVNKIPIIHTNNVRLLGN